MLNCSDKNGEGKASRNSAWIQGATLPLTGEGENPCAPALSPAGTRPHIGHCQGMVEAWAGYFVGFSAPAFAKS